MKHVLNITSRPGLLGSGFCKTLGRLRGFCMFDDIIQSMHSFEVNIRVCQPETSDVRLG